MLKTQIDGIGTVGVKRVTGRVGEYQLFINGERVAWLEYRPKEWVVLGDGASRFDNHQVEQVVSAILSNYVLRHALWDYKRARIQEIGTEIDALRWKVESYEKERAALQSETRF